MENFRKSLLTLSSIILIPFSLSGCGFSPVYGSFASDLQASVEDAMSLIEISVIPDREGQFLRNELIDRLHREGAPEKPRFILSLSPIRESLIDLDITKDSDATRGQLLLESDLQLTDKETDQVVLKRYVRSVASYNILASEFATRVSEQSTRENVLRDMAIQIERLLALHFKRES